MPNTENSNCEESEKEEIPSEKELPMVRISLLIHIVTKRK
jgi:hypothetical protein